MSTGKSSTSSMTETGEKVRILVVDDDKICLAVTASVLKFFNYEVITTNCPLDALSNLRMNNDHFDVILSDVHMPLMNGLNFQRIVEMEFRIPVILMSADDKKHLLMKSLENGAAFFIVKPPSMNDLKNLWQYVISNRRNRSTSPNSTGKDEPCTDTENTGPNDIVLHKTASFVNNEHLSSDLQRSLSIVTSGENTERKITSSGNPKKPKLIWTTALHNKFLEAINVIGSNRAVPKKIMEYMNIPGLTRENIASHLQKYRIYMRRLNESAAMQHGVPMNWNERPFRSSFSWSQFPTLASNSYLLKYSNPMNMNQQGVRALTSNYGQIGENLGHARSSYLGSQGINLVNSQPNTFPSSMNNIGANYIGNDMSNYNNNLNNTSINILESSMLDGQNFNNYDNNGGDDLGNVAMQLVSTNLNDTNPDMVERNNNSLHRLSGLNMHGRDQGAQYNVNLFETNNDYNSSRMITSHGVNKGSFLTYYDGGLSDIVNGCNNQGSNMNNNVSIVAEQETGSNMNNTYNINASNGQVIAGNNAQANPQNQVALIEKDTSTFNGTHANNAIPQHDWAPNHMDDFSRVLQEYGAEDLSTIFSNIDTQNGNDN